MVGYISYCVMSKNYLGSDSQLPGFIILVFLIAIPLGLSILLTTHHSDLDTKPIRDKYGELYLGVSLNPTNKWSTFYYPWVMLKRLPMVMLPLVFEKVQFQIMVLIQMFVFNLIIYGTMRPHIKPSVRRVELASEFMTLILSIINVCFTPFVKSLDARFNSGYAFIGVMSSMLALNFVFLTLNQFSTVKRMKKLKKRNQAARVARR